MRHEAFSKSLAGEANALDGLSSEDIESVTWAVELVRVKAPMADYPLRLEYHVNPMGADFKPLFENGGTLDAACGPVLIDLKSRYRDYKAQVAAYALDMFQEHGWPTVKVLLLFTEGQRCVEFAFTEEEAQAIVDGIISKVSDPNRKPTLCDYCGWCAKKLNCPAKLADAARIAAAREEVESESMRAFESWLSEGAHVSKIEDATMMGHVLKIARTLSEWCESAEYHAKEMATKRGVIPTGFKIQTRQGNRYVTSVTDAFSRLGLPQEAFLGACEIKPSSAFEAYASFNQLKKSQAEKEVERRLGDVIQRKQSTISLVKEKE